MIMGEFRKLKNKQLDGSSQVDHKDHGKTWEEFEEQNDDEDVDSSSSSSTNDDDDDDNDEWGRKYFDDEAHETW